MAHANGDDARSGSGELGRSLDAVEKRKSRDDSTHLGITSPVQGLTDRWHLYRVVT